MSRIPKHSIAALQSGSQAGCTPAWHKSSCLAQAGQQLRGSRQLFAQLAAGIAGAVHVLLQAGNQVVHCGRRRGVCSVRRQQGWERVEGKEGSVCMLTTR